MDDKISALKESQQALGNKISMLQETNRKKDEEADKIRQLIAECRENLSRIKSEAINGQKVSEQKSKTSSGKIQSEGWQSSTSYGSKTEDPCEKFRNQLQPCVTEKEDPCAKYRRELCGGQQEDPCAKYRNQKQPKGDRKGSGPTYKCKSMPSNVTSQKEESSGAIASRIENHLSTLAEVQEKSRKCIDKLGERMEREVKMKIVNSGNCAAGANSVKPFDARGYEGCENATRERISCRVDLSKMKVNIRGPPEDLKKLDAVQLINLLDKFQCQELVINTGEPEGQIDIRGEVPVFYITHPGNFILMVGIVMVAFLINANLCSPRRSCKTKILLNMLYLGSFAFHCGIVLWMSLIRGLTLNFCLPREMFNTVDGLILPKYFSICVFLSAITLYAFLACHCDSPCPFWSVSDLIQVVIESATFLIELIAICYIVPAIIKLRAATEIAASENENEDEDEDCPPPESYNRNVEKLTKLNRMITVLNMLTVAFMGSTLYYMSSRLHIG